jgi:hypothetical protein
MKLIREIIKDYETCVENCESEVGIYGGILALNGAVL